MRRLSIVILLAMIVLQVPITTLSNASTYSSKPAIKESGTAVMPNNIKTHTLKQKLFLGNNTSVVAYPTLYDIDHDGIPELFLPLNYSILALKYNSTNGTFYKLWESKLEVTHTLTVKPGIKNKTVVYSVETSPVFADFNGDGKIELAVGTNSSVIFIGNNGSILKIFPTNTSIVNITAFDADLDGAIEVVMKTSARTEFLRMIDYYSYPGDFGLLFAESIYPKANIRVIAYPRTAETKFIYRLIYATGTSIRTVYYNVSAVPESEYLGSEPVYGPILGNFSYNGSILGAEVLALLKNDTYVFVRYPGGIKLIRASIRDLTGELYGRPMLINNTGMLTHPLVADFDGDGKDEVLLWYKYSVTEGPALNITPIVMLGIKDLDQEELEFKYVNMTTKSVVPVKLLATNISGTMNALALMSNGTIFRIYYNTTDQAIHYEVLTNITGSRYMLTGDINNDGYSELIVLTNDTIHIINLNATTSWYFEYGDEYVSGKPLTKMDYDMDGYYDSADPNATDSDIDNDMMNDYTEFVLGLSATNPDYDNDGLMDGFEKRYRLNPKLNDTDGDNISDALEDLDYDDIPNIFEQGNGTHARRADTDFDGINDYDEIYGTNNNTVTDPTKKDTDGDGIPDKKEFDLDLNPTNYTDGVADFDNDGLLNYGEYVYGTNITNPDTDDDIMEDGFEVYYGLNPTDPSDIESDDDGDGLVNVQEYLIGTKPDDKDTDSDGMPDGWEWMYGLDPLNGTDNTTDIDRDGLLNIYEFKNKTSPIKNDTDLDGMPDGWEVKYRFDPTDPADGYGDADQDYLINKKEYKLGLDPRNPDSDNDGLLDGLELVYGTNYTNPDSDEDGLLDGEEIALGTDPLNPDTDGDGVSDYEELKENRDPLKADIPPQTVYIPIVIILVAVVFVSLILFKRWGLYKPETKK